MVLPRTGLRRLTKLNTDHSHDLNEYHNEIVVPLIARIAALEAPVVVPPVEPPPVEPPPLGAVYYATPTGYDAGAGTLASPWKTPTPFLARAMPGDTLQMTGTWPGTGNGGWAVTRSGTADKPITIQGGTIMGGPRFAFNISGASHVTFANLELLDWTPSDTGTITSTGGAHHLTFRNVKIRLTPGLASTSHTLYMGPGVHDVLVDDPDFDGNGGSGCGISAYGGSGVPPYALVVRGGLIHGFSGTGNAHGRGVNIASASTAGPYLVEGVELRDNKIHVNGQLGRDITVRDCRGNTASVANIARDIAQTPGFVQSGNVWG